MSIEIKQGDAGTVLATMASGSVQCAITSPPYWGLRDYGTATWSGGDATCDHARYLGGNGEASAKQVTSAGTQKYQYRDVCEKCGATSTDAQFGLEKTPDEYVCNLVSVLREVKRVLRDDGTLWLNLGDSYSTQPAGNKTWGNGVGSNKHYEGEHIHSTGKRDFGSGIKNKDLVGIPWAVAFALRADGWYLRSDIIWSKPNPMPESITDRPTKAHEYVFLLSKSASYYYDSKSIAEPAINAGKVVSLGDKSFAKGQANGAGIAPSGNGKCDTYTVVPTRNRRTVWTINTAPYKGAHFATFPPKLVEPMVLAGAPSGGIVLDPFCGSGTVGAVCVSHNRSFIGIELNPAYIKLAHERIAKAQARDPHYLRESGMSMGAIASELKLSIPELARILR